MMTRSVAALVAALCLSCGDSPDTLFKSWDAARPADLVTVSVVPALWTMNACTAKTFTAKASAGGVVWSVVPPEAGTITVVPYTSTLKAKFKSANWIGAATIVATSKRNAAIYSTATVTTQQSIGGVVVTPSVAGLLVSAGPANFSATLLTSCGNLPGIGQ